MKEIDELNFPKDIKYAADHEWAKKEGDDVTVGISDYAQNQLGDIVFVELPKIGDNFEKGQEFGTVESVKAVSELYMPIGGIITAINEALDSSPGYVNEDPYLKGWMIKVKPGNMAEMDDLMSRKDYLDMLKGLE